MKDIPRAGIIARATLIVTGLLVLFLNTGVLGAEATGVAGEPLLDGFAIVGDELAAVLALFALIGLLASLQGIMFAYGRNMYSLSRWALPEVPLADRQAADAVGRARGGRRDRLRRRGPRRAARVDAEGAGAVAGAIVLNIAVWGAVLAYLLQMVAYVILRRKYPNAKRPYRSPWGVPGAIAAAAISALIFLGFLLNPTFVPAIIAIAVVYAVMLIGFGVYGRNHLVLSPEEEYAVSGGLHGDPQAEGYGGRVEEEILASDGVAQPSPSSTRRRTKG